MSSAITELEKNQICKNFFSGKMHHTEFNRRMSSAITELGKRRGLYEVLLRKLLETEYCVCMSSVKTELGETTRMSDFIESHCITLKLAVARPL